MTAIINDLLP